MLTRKDSTNGVVWRGDYHGREVAVYVKPDPPVDGYEGGWLAFVRASPWDDPFVFRHGGLPDEATATRLAFDALRCERARCMAVEP